MKLPDNTGYLVDLSTAESSQQLNQKSVRATTVASQTAATPGHAHAQSNIQSDFISFFASKTNLISVIVAILLAVFLAVVVVLMSVCLVVKLRQRKEKRIGVDKINIYDEIKQSPADPKKAQCYPE